jgi:hypothetical protein
MPLRSGPFTSPPRRIVRSVNCGDNAWDEGLKAIVRVGSVPCAVSCPVLHRCSQILICSQRSAGSMEQVERFAARGWLIGVGNMSRCFLLRTCPSRFLHLLVHHVPCARMTAGVGAIGSHEMRGGGRRNCASRSLACLPFLLSSNTGGTGQPRDDFSEVVSPL